MAVSFNFKSFLSTVLLGAFACAQATDYYFDTGKFRSDTEGVKMNLSESLAYWFTKVDNNYVACTELPDFTDNTNSLYFSAISSSTTTKGGILNIDSNLNLNVLSYTAASMTYLGTADCTSITVKSWTGSSWNTGFSAASADIVVNGNAATTGNAFGKTSYNDRPNKTVTVTGIYTVSNQGTNYSGYYTNTVGTLDAPDASFNIIKSNWGTGVFAYGSYGISGVDIKSDSWCTVNAVQSIGYYAPQSTYHLVDVSLGGGNTVPVTFNFAITNDGKSYTNARNNGGFLESVGTPNKIHVIMCSRESDGEGGFNYCDYSQTFAGDNMLFRGGVTMISGGLYLNYNANGATETHGDLQLHTLGAHSAIFGSATTLKDGTESAVGGTFAFTNLEVSNGGGTIVVRLDMDSEGKLISDKLSFTGTQTGTGDVVLDLRDAGGNTNVDAFVEELISIGASQKVIAWAQMSDDTIRFSTTELYKVYNYEGVDYNFTTTNAADGLYISYVAVPEPATFAALFGVFAVGFAVWRKRK